MTEPTREELDRAHFESAKRSLIDNMVLYGINEQQAVIQVDSLIKAVAKVSAREALRVMKSAQAGEDT